MPVRRSYSLQHYTARHLALRFIRRRLCRNIRSDIEHNFCVVLVSALINIDCHELVWAGAAAGRIRSGCQEYDQWIEAGEGHGDCDRASILALLMLRGAAVALLGQPRAYEDTAAGLLALIQAEIIKGKQMDLYKMGMPERLWQHVAYEEAT